MKVLVIFSGGQDSTTVLIKAIRDGHEVQAITFMYGQRHAFEEQQASGKICSKYNVPQQYHSIELPWKNSALLHGQLWDINKLNDETGLPASFVPNRNQLFITYAHGYAMSIGAEQIWMGMCQTDYSGYPDCRREFIDRLEEAAALGSGQHIPYITPLMYKTKAGTFLLAKELGALEDIVNLTVTCYNGDERLNVWGKGCGECPACKLREKGWKEAFL